MDSRGGVGPIPAHVPSAKLAVPEPGGCRVPRARLIERLQSSTPDQVIVVSAPAGHGKTVLLADLAAQNADRVAWVSLDGADRDDATFWSAVLAALRNCPAVPDPNPIHSIVLPPSPSTNLGFLTELSDGLSALHTPVLLILDDLHRISGTRSTGTRDPSGRQGPLLGIEALLRYLRGGLQLLVATRSDPNLPLARLRLDGRLVELRADALAFTEDEASTLLAQLGLGLSAEQVALVHKQTAGWVAGIRLAALSLQETDDVDGFLADLVGNDRAIADFLVTEVLSRIAPDRREFLTRICVCEQVSASLAEALTDNPAAGSLLAALEDESSLVVSRGRGRQWFVIHPLLRAYLTAELCRRDPRFESQLYARAARWHSAAGEPTEALRNAELSRDARLLAEVLEAHASTLLNDGQHAAIRMAHAHCAAELSPDDPALCLVLALSFQESGQFEAATEFAERAVRHWPEQPDGELIWLRSLAEVSGTWLVGRPRSTTLSSPESRPSAPADERAVESLGRAAVAAASGDTKTLRHHAQVARGLAVDAGNRYLEARSLMLEATADSLDGLVGRAADHARLADETAPPEAWRATTDEAVTATMRAYDALMRGVPAEALALATPQSQPVASRGAGRSGTLGTLNAMIRGTAEIDRAGDVALGLRLLREARERTDPRAGYTQGAVVGPLWEHEAALDSAHLQQALECRSWLQDAFPSCGEVALLAANSALARGRLRSAHGHLSEVLSGSRPVAIQWAMASAAVLGCTLALRAGQRQRAHDLLTQALTVCVDTGVVRPLLKAPADVLELMSSSGRRLSDQHDELIARVLGARELLAPLESTLTAREREVLDLLPSLRSLDEIAVDLWLSPNTVKTHVKAIYAKLGVNSRREAVQVGRRHGLVQRSDVRSPD